MRDYYGNTILDFSYDASGRPYAMHYNSTPYFYILNLQGDVIRMVDGNGNTVASYEYDPYGKVISATGWLADINPIRYRGYYYDQETGLYHLWSRYYDPQTGRFISADALASTGQGILGNNMFAYCGNDPIQNIDSLGYFGICVLNDPMNVYRAYTTPGMFGGGGGFGIPEVSSSYFAMQNVRAYDSWWQNSYYNSNMTWSNGATGNGALIGTGGNVSSSGNASAPAACFIAGTLVKSEAGNVPIESVSTGDYVWAWDEETDDVALKEVVETYVNETVELVHVFVSGEEIIATPSHPFYSPVKGWTEAIRLRAGDILVLLNGEYVVVEKVQHELLERPILVYNFQVEGYHTYYVTNAGVLVHNVCAKAFDDNQQAVLDIAKENRDGLSRSEAEILVEWAKEYGIRNHGIMIHTHGNGFWSGIEHIKIKNIHIAIIVE